MQTSTKHRSRTNTFALLLALTALGGTSARASAPPPCEVSLSVELTPDVPDPQDAGFLSSLLDNHPAYHLRWLGRIDDQDVLLNLSGPGPDEQCQAVLQTIRNDGRVLSIHTEPGELASVSVTRYRLPPRVASPSYVSRAGLGSLVWAARHPAHAWRVVLPMRPGDPAYADVLAANASLGDSGIALTKTGYEHERSSAAPGHLDAETVYALGSSFDGPDPNDLREAFHFYLRAAKLGEVEAMNRLGVMYAEGRGVPQNYAAALTWYRRAAAGGSETAQLNLATLYFHGFGVRQSYEKAASLLEQLAGRGNPSAENKLATLYDEGLGVPLDHAHARELFRLAAVQGYTPAMLNLGRMLAEAIGGERNDIGGYALIRAAIDAGIPTSMSAMAFRELGALTARLDGQQLARAQSLASELSASLESGASQSDYVPSALAVAPFRNPAQALSF